MALQTVPRARKLQVHISGPVLKTRRRSRPFRMLQMDIGKYRHTAKHDKTSMELINEILLGRVILHPHIHTYRPPASPPVPAPAAPPAPPAAYPVLLLLVHTTADTLTPKWPTKPFQMQRTAHIPDSWAPKSPRGPTRMQTTAQILDSCTPRSPGGPP